MGLSGDVNYNRNDPHVLHIEPGLKFRITWGHRCPHMYEKQVEELRLASRIAACKVACVPEHGFQMMANVLNRVKEHDAKSEVLNQFIQKRVAEFELAEHRMGRTPALPQ